MRAAHPFLPALTDNPILRREAVPRMLRRMDWDGRTATGTLLLVASVFLGVLLSSLGPDSAEIFVHLLAWGWALLTVLVTVTTTSRGIVHERSLGTWDALVMTRLRPADIILGKLLAPLLPLWIGGLALLPALLLLASSVTGDSSIYLWLLVAYGIAILYGLSFGAVGLYLSMQMKTVGSALFATLGVIFGILQVAGIVVAFVSWMAIGTDLSDIAAGLHASLYVLFSLAPGFVALADLIGRFHRLDRGRRRRG